MHGYDALIFERPTSCVQSASVYDAAGGRSACLVTDSSLASLHLLTSTAAGFCCVRYCALQIFTLLYIFVHSAAIFSQYTDCCITQLWYDRSPNL